MQRRERVYVTESIDLGAVKDALDKMDLRGSWREESNYSKRMVLEVDG